MSSTVVVLDAERLLGEALAESLSSTIDAAVDVVEDADSLWRRLADAPVDLVIVVAAHPGPTDFQVVGSASKEASVLLLPRDGDLKQCLLSVVEAGGLGVVSPQSQPAEFARVVEAALRGEACVPRGMLGDVLRHLVARRRIDREVLERYGRLTTKERQVLLELTRGESVAEIAREQFVSPATVRSHAQHILEKLGVHTRAAAVELALEHGLVDPDTGEVHP